MQDKKKQLDMHMEQWTGSNLDKKFTNKMVKMAKFILCIFYHNKEKEKKIKVNALQGNKTMTFGIISSRRTKVICN